MPPAYNELQFDQAPSASYAPEASYGYEYVYGSSFASDAFFNLWIFSQINDFGRSDRRHYLVDHDRQRDLFRRTKDRTHYVNEHDRVVDRSIDPEWLQRLTNRTLAGEPARRYLRRNVPMETVSQGQEIFRHGRDAEHTRLNAPTGPAAGAGGIGSLDPQGIRNSRNNAPGPNAQQGGEQRFGAGQVGQPNNPGGDSRRNRAFNGLPRNPVAGLGALPQTPASPNHPLTPPAVGAVGQAMPGRLFGNGLPGSRMHVVNGIGPSTDGLVGMPAAGAGLQPGPAPVGVPHVARVPVGVQPPALGIPHAPGPAMAPIVVPSAPIVAAPVPAIAASAPMLAPAPSAPASVPRAGIFNHFGAH